MVIEPSEVPLTIPVEKPLLVNLGSVAVTRDIESLALNNDTLAVVDGQAASADIKKIQQFLYGASLRRHGSSVFDTHLISHATSLQQFVPPFLVPHLLSIDPNYEALQHLAAIGMGKTAREVRQDIIKATENNTIFSQNILGNGPYSQFLPESEKIRQAAALLRSQVQSQLGWFNWLFLPSAQYQQFKMAASISDDDKFLTIMREKNRMALLKTNIVYTSGPGAVAQSWLGRLFFKREEINERIAPFSFAHYRLDKVFISDNGMPLHANAKEALAKMSGTELGKTNDLSWLEEGQNATVVREQKIQKILDNLPQNFQEMRGKVQAHIKKIEVDLEGCFGFYRYRERHAKIRALQGILTHFSDGFFDVDGFQNALNNYRSNDISASLWKSETKALIDDLVQFCEQAKNYELTNSQGQVSLPVLIPSAGLLV
ncbi:hypothetical protein [Legionella feeleii]|uniref:Uncharacterized protein n=1 Tax=Legionella feeleii TaxID=453 RepID=A0A2X1QPQ9_9GAMM|nr:hypothetical protein [Legionella feeleii]SPX59297.1 Uncharacterised protein [Legionella feeleii]